MAAGEITIQHPSPRVLLVVKEPPEARRIALFLQDQGMEAIQVRDDQAGYNILDTEQIDGLVAEIRSPRIDGMRLLRVAKMRNPDVCAILLASPSDLDLATRALTEGAHDFQTRPVNLEKILAVIRRGLSVQRMVGEMHEMATRLDRKLAFRNLIGSSAPFARVYGRIVHVCGTDAPVLVLGESGTGRDLVARTIHHNSARRAGPLVTIDAEGLEPGFLESELFGQEIESGRARSGRIEAAEGGTLVINDVDAVPLTVQAPLLRLLREREYTRVGERKVRRADLRLIAIGSDSIRSRVGEGSIRADLFECLSAVTIEMPPLRARRRDIPLLAERFLEEACAEAGRPVQGIKPAALDILMRYQWPGNVRELKTVVRGMVIPNPSLGPLDVADIPEEIRTGGGSIGQNEIRIPVGASLADAERRLIDATLDATGGDRARAARILGIGLRTLQRRLAEYRRETRPRRRMSL